MLTREAVVMEAMFKVADKDGIDLSFKLNAAQTELDSNISGRDLIPKARQRGVSTYFLARYTAACHT